MPIPDYQTLMLPVLRSVADEREHRVSAIIETLASEFGLSDGERQELLPSGRQSTFSNRVHWAKTYLSQAGLLAPTRRAHFKITARGISALQAGPQRIDVAYLLQFPEFVAFRERAKTDGTRQATAEDLAPITVAQTPDEVLSDTIRQIETTLRSELLDRILGAPPRFFESVIVALLLAMGYGGSRQDAGQVIGRSGDGGLDGVIDQDALGLDRVYIQAKRYAVANAVSEPEVRAFSGSLGAAKASKGIFVTTSYFTQPAILFAEKHPFRIVLIDGEQLTGLMVAHNVGARIDQTFHIKKVDEDFFSPE